MGQTSFYSQEELADIGFRSYGEDVLISRKCSIYGASNISIGNHVRIDDFSILSGNITFGNYIHIGAFCALYGSGGIEFMNYSGMSPRCTVFSATDDFSGNYLMGPTIPERFTNVKYGRVIFQEHVNVGAGSIVMPGVNLSPGVAIGTMSLVRKSLKGWKVYSCLHPLEYISPRSHAMEELAKELES